MGRKPIGEAALTPAEKQARLRERQADKRKRQEAELNALRQQQQVWLHEQQNMELSNLRHLAQWIVDSSSDPMARQRAVNIGYKPTYDI